METCTVTGKIYNLAGEPLANRLVQFGVNSAPKAIDEIGLSNDVIEVYTNDLGEFSQLIVTGVYFNIKIDDIGYNRVHKIPEGTTVINWTDLIEYDASAEALYPPREPIN